MFPALLLAPLLAFTPQNIDQPGQVHLGDGLWGTPAQALEAEMVQHDDLWFPKKLGKKLRKWDKEDARKGLTWKDRYRTKSKYYRIETNVPRWRIELEIKPFLDALFLTYMEVFERDFGLSGKAVKNKDIRIYNGFNDYSVNEPDDGQPRPRTNPGFIVGGSTLVVFYDETDPGAFYGTVFHEGAHQFFLSLLPGADPPIWLTEALATYFEGCTYSRATNTVTQGHVPADRLNSARGVLSKDKDPNAQELFLDVPKPRFKGREYALAWSFVHYLINRPGDHSRERFAAFVRETNGAGVKPAAEIFKKGTKENLEDLIPGWRAHVLALEVPDELEWVIVAPSKDAPEDISKGDLMWSFDGVDVFSPQQYSRLWRDRAKDRDIEVVVVRCEPDMHSDESTRRFVRFTLPAGSPTLIRAIATVPRDAGLSD
jgi:hypothetical protein